MAALTHSDNRYLSSRQYCSAGDTISQPHWSNSHTIVISLTELVSFSTWQLWAQYKTLIWLWNNRKEHKQRERNQKHRLGDTMTMNVCPVINISLHHCSWRKRTKCKAEHDEKLIIFWHNFEIHLCNTKTGRIFSSLWDSVTEKIRWLMSPNNYCSNGKLLRLCGFPMKRRLLVPHTLGGGDCQGHRAPVSHLSLKRATWHVSAWLVVQRHAIREQWPRLSAHMPRCIKKQNFPLRLSPSTLLYIHLYSEDDLRPDAYGYSFAR